MTSTLVVPAHAARVPPLPPPTVSSIVPTAARPRAGNARVAPGRLTRPRCPYAAGREGMDVLPSALGSRDVRMRNAELRVVLVASPIAALRRRWGAGLRGRFLVREVADRSGLEQQ